MSARSNPTAAASLSANATAADSATGYGVGSDLKVLKDLNDFKVFFLLFTSLIRIFAA